jgi:hypothetical protein
LKNWAGRMPVSQNFWWKCLLGNLEVIKKKNTEITTLMNATKKKIKARGK